MEYYEKADHNINTKRYLHHKTPKYIDWEVITIFYATMHLVNNYFKKNNIELPEKHGEMFKTLKKLSNLSKISKEQSKILYESYHVIFRKSLDARYRPDVEISDDDLKSVNRNFHILKSILMRDIK